ncbi:MAG: hypothetical protein ABW137_25770 [Mycobacterium sp.]
MLTDLDATARAVGIDPADEAASARAVDGPLGASGAGAVPQYSQ